MCLDEKGFWICGESLWNKTSNITAQEMLSSATQEVLYVKIYSGLKFIFLKQTLQWYHNEHDGVSNHQPRDCLLSRLFRRRP